MRNALTSFEEWFEDFRIRRVIKFQSQREAPYTIDGRALYAYQLDIEEFSTLRTLFCNSYRGLTINCKLNEYYGAAFVLLGSEYYRREYRRNWSWEAIDEFIGLESEQIESREERIELVNLGFKFWKLEEIKGSAGKGRDFLGTLLLQGGLPWRLVQDHDDNLGRAIQYLFKNYTHLIQESGTLNLGLSRFLEKYRIPKYQCNKETYELIIGVVESVIRLQRKYPDLDKVLDPALYLDEHEPTWIYEFPLPLDQENASTLLKEWFKDARTQIDEQKQSEENQSNRFISEFYWNRKIDFTDCLREGLVSKIYPPSNMVIRSEHLQTRPATLRLELLIYEGDLPVAKGKIIYAQQNEEDDLLINFKQLIANAFYVKRRDLEERLIVKLMSGGISIYEEVIEESALSSIASPLFLIASEKNYYQLLSDNGSFSTKHSSGFLYIPKTFTISDQPISDFDHFQYVTLFSGEEADWVEIEDKIVLVEKDDPANRYFYEVKSEDSAKAIHLTGKEAVEYRGRSSRYIYRGFPNLINAPSEVEEYVNGELLSNLNRHSLIGLINYQAKTRDGKTLLTRRFAVLPEAIEFHSEVVSLNSQIYETTLKAYERKSKALIEIEFPFSLNQLCPSIKAVELEEGGYHLTLQDIDNISDGVTIEIPSTNHIDPLLLTVPIYLSGMRLHKDGRLLPIQRELSFSLDELIGYELIIQDQKEIRNLNIVLELHTKYYNDFSSFLRTHNRIVVNQQRVIFSLYGFKEEIERMFAIVDDLDARVTLELSVPHMKEVVKLNISRFHISGSLYEVTPQLILAINGIDEQNLGDLELEWISLVDPLNKKDLTYSKTIPQGALASGEPITQVYCFENLKHESLGLIISKEGSRYDLRPILTFNESAILKSSFEKGSVERAVIEYHPVNNPDAFEDLFLSMLEDQKHGGWEYFKALIEGPPETLSLSTFAAWKMLVKKPDLLTLLFFKFNLSVEFCERLRNELGVIWEAIPFESWRNSWQRYYSDLNEMLGDNHNIQITLMIFNGYMDKLALLMPVHNLLKDFIHQGNAAGFLENRSDVESTLRIPKNNLIATNDNRYWPTFLQQEFGYWLKNIKDEQELLSDEFYRFLISSEEPLYRYPSLILPVYMAAIAANRGEFLDIIQFISDVVTEDQKDIDFKDRDSTTYISSELEQLIKLKFIYQQISHFDYEWYEKCFHYALADLLAS